jgi:tetratricopeptide (TPR) repeat protein
MPCSIRSANRILALAAAFTVAAVRPVGGAEDAGRPPPNNRSNTHGRTQTAAPVEAEVVDGGARSPRADAPPEVRDAGIPPGMGLSPPQPLSPESEQFARAQFERAQRAYDLGRFETAIIHYGRAYEAMPLAAFLFNIAQCHRLLGEYAQAAFFYRRYLDLAGNPSNAPLTRELLSEMEQRQSERERHERETAARASAALAMNPDGAEAEPLYKRWWFWAAVGGAVVAGMTAVTIANSQPSQTTLGTLNGR